MKKIDITKRIIFLSAIVAYLIEMIEEIEGHNNIFNKTLKMVGKRFLSLLDGVLNVIYNGADEEATKQGNDVVREVAEILDKTFISYSDLIDEENKKIKNYE